MSYEIILEMGFGILQHLTVVVNKGIHFILFKKVVKSVFFLECPILYFWSILYLNSFYLKLIKT